MRPKRSIIWSKKRAKAHAKTREKMQNFLLHQIVIRLQSVATGSYRTLMPTKICDKEKISHAKFFHTQFFVAKLCDKRLVTV